MLSFLFFNTAGAVATRAPAERGAAAGSSGSYSYGETDGGQAGAPSVDNANREVNIFICLYLCIYIYIYI